MGLITPGPVVITATFIGYLNAIFTPIFPGVVLPGPVYPPPQRADQGVRPRRHHLGGRRHRRCGHHAVPATDHHRPSTVAIAAVTLAMLLRWKIKEPYVVAAGAIAGIVLHWPW
jgi:chromate transporter